MSLQGSFLDSRPTNTEIVPKFFTGELKQKVICAAHTDFVIAETGDFCQLFF